MRALRKAKVEHVVWVTLREQRSVYVSINGRIRQAAGRWKGFAVADWNAASRGKRWFGSDGLHLNSAGATGLARLLRPQVVQAVAQSRSRAA
jgi:hypothetical protein